MTSIDIDGPVCHLCSDGDPSDCERHGLCCDDCHDGDPAESEEFA